MNKITAEDDYTIVTIERKGEADNIVDFVDMCRCAAHALGSHLTSRRVASLRLHLLDYSST